MTKRKRRTTTPTLATVASQTRWKMQTTSTVCCSSQACLPIIYAQEWSNVSERVLKQFGITRLRPEVLVQT